MPSQQFDEEIHLRDYLRVIFKRRWLVAAVFVILVTTVTIHTFLMDPVYRATSQIVIEKKNPNIVNVEEVLGVNASDQDYYQTQYEIIKSQSVILKVIKKLNLKESPEFTSPNAAFSLRSVLGTIAGWIKDITSSADDPKEADGDPNPDREYNQLIAAYAAQLEVDPIRNSRLVKVSFEGKDPSVVANIVNTHARLYIESNLERKFAAAQEAVTWLNKRIDDEKKNLEKVETAIQAFREKEGLASIDFEERQGIIVQSLNDLNAALTQAKTEKIEKKNTYSEIQRLSNTPELVESMPAVVSNALIQGLKAQYVALTGEYHKLSEKYGPEHPTMVRLSSEIREVKKKIAQEVKKIAQSIETEYRVATAKEKSIMEAMEEMNSEALALNRKQIKYNAFKREVETSRSLYESLLKRVKEAGLTEGLEVTNIAVVDPARIPNAPVKPRKAMNILLSVVVGLTLGVGLAFFLEYLDNTVKSPEEVERYLNIPLLGVIGRFTNDSITEGSDELIALNDPKSTVSEAFRTIRTNILFASPDIEKKVILVTSAFPAEGKTVAACNLAVSFSQMGKKVLLVDADLRRPRLHTVFNLGRPRGLSDFLIGKETSIHHAAEVAGLHIMVSGTSPPNPAELLGSRKMEDFIAKAKEKFDVIVVDSPPLLSVTDATELTTFTDGVVLVVKAFSTPRPAIQRGIKHLAGVDAKTFGCILNDVDFEKEGYYYSYYKDYYHYYYYDDKKGGSQKKKRSARAGRST
ncbi:MAG: polysaccharide biosynthesis tyrosine autokinase [Deltaproteobacteria bacterium]|nr:polysaccharide biosynthesis tyrosine autokinase [Deltaproteobacteria bacterium]